jgi:PBP4 family serine-type D-alanyl-D-alanine carboxypeptidase
VKPLLKDSLNLYAETLVRAMGLALKSEGSFAKGKEIVEEVLEKTGIKKEDFKYADGSGLSRQNLQSPETLTKVLRQMKQHQYFSCFYDALPIAGVDGTLAERMKNTKAENNARAKTGTLSNVSAIAGYVRSASGEMLAFAIMANNYPGKKTAAESAEDKAIDALAKFTRK